MDANVKKVFEESPWFLATCGDEPHVVPVGFKTITEDGKFAVGAVLLETRRHTKEMAAQRELADKAEASRFTELREHLNNETARLTEAFTTNGSELLARIDRLEMGLREGPESGAQGAYDAAAEPYDEAQAAIAAYLEAADEAGIDTTAVAIVI